MPGAPTAVPRLEEDPQVVCDVVTLTSAIGGVEWPWAVELLKLMPQRGEGSGSSLLLMTPSCCVNFMAFTYSESKRAYSRCESQCGGL